MTSPAPRLRLVEAAPLCEHGDDDLMRLARGGHPTAFDELVRRHQRRAIRVAARYLGESSLALDAVQAAFFEVYRALPRYRAQSVFSAYLYRILLNQCRMIHRSRRRDHHVPDSVLPDPDVGPAPEQILARERTREMERAVASLSPKLRDVVVLRYGADLSYHEIAAALDLPLGTVKRRLFDSMEMLRRILEAR